MEKKTSKHVNIERDGLAIKAEYLQTDRWVIPAIMQCEIMTQHVIDPCCGDGRMAEAAKLAGHSVLAIDKYDWGYNSYRCDWLEYAGTDVRDATVFMNSPFSIACEFVDHALNLGARKIIAFQRSVWRESGRRKNWFNEKPPNRIYVCGDRANCWYGTIPSELRKGGMNQPHSIYVWERGQPPGTLLGAIWKDRT